MSVTARLRRSAHAKQDSLERSTVFLSVCSRSALFLYARHRLLLNALATAVLAGEPTVEGVVERVGRKTLGRNWKWIRPLARRYVKAHAGQSRPRRRAVARFLAQDKGFARAWAKYFNRIRVANWLTEPQKMQPVAAAAGWSVPAIESVGALADWLRLDPS